MALSKTAKIWLIVLAIPVLLIVGCIIFVNVYFTSDRLKAMILPKIEKATNRDVAVSNISISLFPSIGVKLDKVAISNPRGTSFDRPNTATLEQLQLNVNLFDLLHNVVKVNRIILDKPVVYLEVSEDGSSNYKTKKSATEAEKPSGMKTENSGTLLLSNFEIRDGQILSVDKKYDARYAISGLNASADGEAVRGDKTMGLNVKADIDQFSYGTVESYFLSGLPVNTEGKLTFNIEAGTLSIDTMSIRLKDLPLAMHGTIGNLYGNDMQLDLLITSPNATMDKVLSLVPPDMLKSTKGISSTGDIGLSVAVKGISNDTISPGVTGHFTVANGKIQYSGLPKSITNVNISGMFDKPQAPVGAKGIGTFSLDKFSASLGSSTLSGKLTMTNFSDPNVAANIVGSMNLGEVKEFYPLEAGTEVGGMLKSNVTINGRAKVPASIKAGGTVEFNDVTMKSAGSPQPLQHLNGVIAFNNQAIESKQLSMVIGQSDLSMGFKLNNYLGLVMKDKEIQKAAAPNASVTLTSRLLRTADLVAEKSKDSTAVKGKSNKDQSGVLPAFDMTANVSIGKLVMQKFEFSNVHGTLTASNGIVNLQNLILNTYGGTIASKGTLDLRDTAKRPFDFSLDIKNVESNGLLSNFTSFGKNLAGKINMNTHMKGDLNDTLGLTHQSLLGNGSAAISDGKLLGFALTNKLADATGLESMRQLNFKDWTNNFSIADGRVLIKDLNIHSSVSDFVVGGSQGLDGSMDYSLSVKIPAALSGQLKLQGVGDQLLQFFKDKDGRVNLNFAVTGTADSPALRLDTQAQQEMAKKALQDKASDLLKGKGDDAKKKVEEGLKKLFKRP